MQDEDSALLETESSSEMRAACAQPSRILRPDQSVLLPASCQIPPVNPNCFVCGPHNRSGLHLIFERAANGVEAIWVPDDTSESFQDTVHGGVITSVLDEAMSKAIMACGWQALTVCVNVRFHSRTSPGERLRVRGWIVQRRKRRILTEADLFSDSTIERAHAWATFLIPAGSPVRNRDA